MGAKMTDNSLYLQLGMNQKTGLPARMDATEGGRVKQGIKQVLRIMDEQDAVNRYQWYNLPKGLNGQMIERILYYKGQGMLFALNDQFYFLPYALDGTIDVYGRFTGVTPLPLGGKTSNEDKAWIKDLRYRPLYDVSLGDEDPRGSCVLLHDYTKQLSQTITPRQQLNDQILDVMAEAYPFARTNLLANSGIKGMRVNGPQDAGVVEAAGATIKDHALMGNPYIAVTGSIEMQELTEGGNMKTEEYLAYMQSLDNFRLKTYGIESGGIFEKKAHMLEAENATNQSNSSLVYQDGLTIRQRFCTIVNSLWGLSVWCDTSDAVDGLDKDGDGTTTNDEQGGAEDGDDY